MSGADTLWARVIGNFQSVQRSCVILSLPDDRLIAGSSRDITIRIFNPYPYPLDMNHETLPLKFQAAFFSGGRLKAKSTLFFTDSPGTVMPGDTVEKKASFTIPVIDAGEYGFAITTEAGFLLDVVSSTPAIVSVSDAPEE